MQLVKDERRGKSAKRFISHIGTAHSDEELAKQERAADTKRKDCLRSGSGACFRLK